MKKKIISAAMAVVLMLVACAISVGAINPYSDFEGKIDIFANSTDLGASNSPWPKTIILPGYKGFVYAKYTYLSNVINVSAKLNKAHDTASYNLKVNIQCVVEYTDNTYDMFNLYGSTLDSAISESATYFSANGKVVQSIDVEYHFYVNNSYLTTLNIQG